MLKQLFNVLFGTKPVARPSTGPPAPWREPPIATDKDVGYGAVASISYPTGHHGFIQVVGESHYQDTLEQLSVLFETIGRDERNFTVKLVPEPDNPHDANAVAVVTEGNAKVGYLSRDVAKSYQKVLLRQKEIVTCPARLYGGEADKPSIGVVLDFDLVRRLK